MFTLTIAVDLAKHVFEIAVATRAGRISERKRFTRGQFEEFWTKRAPCRVVMEACASAHFWARFLIARGFNVVLLPPGYVKPYRRRNKTDRADCEALLEADRCAGIKPVTVKSKDQQALLALHRVRAQWMASRTARINTMRGLLVEFGVRAAVGAERFLKDLPALLGRKQAQLPQRLCRTVLTLYEEVRELEQRIETLETDLEGVTLEQPVIQTLRTIPGIGLLTATALYATIGNIHAFGSGRQLACWLGLTPREHSSGGQHRLGRISKQGDPYLRMLLVHGARSALNAARRRDHAGQPLTRLQSWSLERARSGHSNKATVALANKLVRIVWAVWYHDRAFNGNHGQPQAA